MPNWKQTDLFQSTSSPRAPRASRSRSQANSGEPTTPDTSGLTSSGSSRNADLLSSFSRMLRDTFDSASMKFGPTWKTKATPSGRSIFQLRVSAPRTAAIDSGSSASTWLTPNAMDSLTPRSPEALKKNYTRNRQGRQTHSTLREQVAYPPPKMLWPSPTASDYGGPNKRTARTSTGWQRTSSTTGTSFGAKLTDVETHEARLWPTPTVNGNNNHKGASKTSGDGLGTAVLNHNTRQWRTPTSTERSGINPKKGTIEGLSKQVKQWPTPTVQDGENTAGPAQWTRNSDPLNVAIHRADGVAPPTSKPSGKPTLAPLNPGWVEWLMGYPSGWTASKP